MGRLIDAEDFEKFLRTLESAGAGDYSTDGIISMLEKQPTVDAVEVVRCKDCKHRSSTGFCKHPRHIVTLPATYPSDFCSYGERRSDGEESKV